MSLLMKLVDKSDLFKLNAYQIKNWLEDGLTEEEVIGRMFLRQLSNFIWNKHNEGNLVDELYFKEVKQELENYRITYVSYNNETQKFILKSARPGVIIGVRGSNIDKIDKHLFNWAKEEKIPYSGIALKEDRNPLENDINYSLNMFSLLHSDPDF